MREHLYRGFHPIKNGTTEITLNGAKIKGDWVYGDLTHRGYSGKTQPYIREADAGVEWYVLPETVGEYTGLTDSNGNKIFEGDIVISRMSSSKYFVSWRDCQFEIKDKWGNIYVPKQEFLNHIELEVIGNIYEIPRLLS